jgi:hypothetical protein
MNFNRFFFGPLREEAAGDPQGGGSGAPAPAATPSFDPVAFKTELRTELLTEIRKDINGIDKKFNKQFDTFNTGFSSFKSDLEKMLKPAEPAADPHQEPAPPAPAAGNPPPPAPPANQPPKPSPEMLRLQRELQEMRDAMKANEESTNKAKADAAKKEMHAALKAEISRHKFATDKDPVDMFKLLVNDLQQGDDGQYYGPEGITLEELVRNEWSARPNWQPARPVNGAGAPAPSTVNGRSTFDLDRIRSGMSAEERQQLALAIQQNLKQ